MERRPLRPVSTGSEQRLKRRLHIRRHAAQQLAALVERTADPAVRGRALVTLADAERSRGRDREADVVLERLHREFPDLAAGVGSAP